MIEKRADELAQRLDAERIHNNSASAGRTATLGAGLGALRAGGGGAAGRGGKGGDGRGTVTVQFFEKRRRKAWYGGGRDEEVCWESWTVRVTVAEPRTETGGSPSFPSLQTPEPSSQNDDADPPCPRGRGTRSKKSAQRSVTQWSKPFPRPS